VSIYTLPAAAFDAGPLKTLTGAAKCDVKVVPLNYKTIGVSGEKTNASGVLLLPAGSNCTAPAGLVAYAKGTDVQKLRTLANPGDGETLLLAAVYAAQGYAVVATDYLGFAKSEYPYHPYLHADSEASSVIDSSLIVGPSTAWASSCRIVSSRWPPRSRSSIRMRGRAELSKKVQPAASPFNLVNRSNHRLPSILT
jgi:hypothetical protein